MRHSLTTIFGKGVRQAAILRGGGSALPGLFVEKIDPRYVTRTLSQLPKGVVLISGTNGKTTTTKMVVELLESQGLRVFTNRTGSNFTRGVAAALLGDVDARGRLNADIAVLELDEAYAVHFVKAINPSYCLLLNVMRDQLDRFGEIDKTAELLHTVATHTTKGVVLNRDDPRLGTKLFTENIHAPINTYGVHESLLAQFPSDDDLRGNYGQAKHVTVNESIDTQLDAVDGQTAQIRFGQTAHSVTLKLKGIYNVLNAVGAVALVRTVVGDALDEAAIFERLANVTPAFGRGETVLVDGDECELVLVKNPAGFRLSLASFSPEGHEAMIAINDNYADGRDMSWLWDVDFDSLQTGGVRVVTGVRAYDMALRLDYDEVPFETVTTSLEEALNEFLQSTKGKPKRIFCTYTAMLTLRKLLSKRAHVEVIR